MIPIERKRTRAANRPYDDDLFQGIAYCILIEDEYGQTPPYVRIQYADRWFDGPYTPQGKEWALRWVSACARRKEQGPATGRTVCQPIAPAAGSAGIGAGLVSEIAQCRVVRNYFPFYPVARLS